MLENLTHTSGFRRFRLALEIVNAGLLAVGTLVVVWLLVTILRKGFPWSVESLLAGAWVWLALAAYAALYTSWSIRDVWATLRGTEGADAFPENLYEVLCGDSGMDVTAPDGIRHSVLWADLDAVELVAGRPEAGEREIFWVLRAGTQRCVVPIGARGEPALFERLRALSGFDEVKVIDAMSARGEGVFRCWTRRALTSSASSP